MSVFAAAAKLIASLAALGQQGAGLGLDSSGWSGSESSAEGKAVTGLNMAGDGGSLVLNPFAGYMISGYIKSLPQDAQEQFFGQLGGLKGAKQHAQGLSIISWTITTVELLALTAGFGTPYEGDSLKGGSQQFTTLAEQLKSALPDTGWEGSASDAYAGLDTALRNAAQTMAGLDDQLAALVKAQAEWVGHMQLAFGILKDFLLVALVIEMTITFTVPAPAGPVAAKAFAITVAVLGIGAAVSFLGTLLGYSIEHATKADALAVTYSELAGAIVQNGAFTETGVATATESTVASFEAISAGMSGTSAAVGGPSVASRAGEADGPAKSAPDQTAPSTSTANMPTLVQLAATTGQATNLSSHEDLVNRARGQLRTLAQAARQGKVAQTPAATAEEVRAADGDVEGTGAGLGTLGAERAPVEAAPADAPTAQAPRGVERAV